MTTECTTFEVAGIVFAISSDRPVDIFQKENPYRDFACSRVPDVTIHARSNGMPGFSLLERDRVFDSDGIWSLYRVDGQNMFALISPSFGPLPYRIAVFDGDFQRGDIYTRSFESREVSDELLSNPLVFPLSEVLMVCLLAQGRGLMVHACGVDNGGRGYLFAGNSTHGKTTMARLWKDRAIILNDDRIVLRRHEGRFWMYGTPWHGEYTGVSSRGVPLEKVFFLSHAETNYAVRKEDVDAASILLTRCFLPLWAEEGMRFTLDFCAQLVSEVPCYTLGFVPDEGVVDFTRGVK
jgi:hypothetical protein